MNAEYINNLIELLGTFENKVEIPIVQRDYAQGRQDEKTKLVRGNLLADMRSAILRETPPLDLNFVYGKAENRKFIPVDGQQRLTTLFLLHLYAFRNDDSKTELLNRFTYETRTSSRDFFERLTKSRADVFQSDLLPSEEIEDSEWFVSEWKNDPTIQSALVMLNDIASIFSDIDDLNLCLQDDDYKPIVFKFLDIKNLGMEDSLYIKLNARGKPLTLFEEFKARLIGRLKKLLPDFALEFEHHFDTIWADLFWAQKKSKFDQVYLAFFGLLLMNNGIIRSDYNWSNAFNFNLVDKDIFRTAFYTLDYLYENTESKACRFVLSALEDRPTYPQRVLFHAVTTYLFESEGIDNGSFGQWLRIIQNLTLNTPIDNDERYRRAIDGINKLVANFGDLLEYCEKGGGITGFSREQIIEEQDKAWIIQHDKVFAKAIYEAESHPYFNGQIRSALNYAIQGGKDSEPSLNIFINYWEKISALFDEARPKYGRLMRQALLTFGDYTLPVDNCNYQTLCVDDPKEGASTPSLKRLFSNCGEIVKQLLDNIIANDDISKQLKSIIQNADIPQNDWRHCFIRYPELFGNMSSSHLRIRNVGGEWIMVPNQKSTGYNDDLYIATLQKALKIKQINSTHYREQGTWCDRYLSANEYFVRYKKGKYSFTDAEGTIMYETETDMPITEAVEYFMP